MLWWTPEIYLPTPLDSHFVFLEGFSPLTLRLEQHHAYKYSIRLKSGILADHSFAVILSRCLRTIAYEYKSFAYKTFLDVAPPGCRDGQSKCQVRGSVTNLKYIFRVKRYRSKQSMNRLQMILSLCKPEQITLSLYGTFFCVHHFHESLFCIHRQIVWTAVVPTWTRAQWSRAWLASVNFGPLSGLGAVKSLSASHATSLSGVVLSVPELGRLTKFSIARYDHLGRSALRRLSADRPKWRRLDTIRVQ